MAPLVVIEGEAGSRLPAPAARAVLRDLADDGWSVAHDSSPSAPARIVYAAVVADAAAARRALIAALGGAAIVITAAAGRLVVDALLEDLRRLGPVHHVTRGGDLPPRLRREGRSLLALLAEGLTLGEAAAELGLSRRTADRRLGAAREALGVERTVEAVARARWLGWLGPPD